nr:GNAT family N-acetyltransferase [Kibdelosporangium sp. MJ126-NF4]CEL18131.1 putative acetyltransferase [Kibdelosporangium sp. MJ126-NF4]CTQ90640.1 putative acetyltransferase [Kibdelosporangium sp. MJ126-NF4]
MRIQLAEAAELATVLPDTPATQLDGLRAAVTAGTGACLVAYADTNHVAGHVIFTMMHSTWDAAEFLDVHQVSVHDSEVAAQLLARLREIASERGMGAIRFSTNEDMLLVGAEPTHRTKRRFTLAVHTASATRHSMIRRVQAEDVMEIERLCRAHAVYEKAQQQAAGFASRLMSQLLAESPRVWGWVVPADDGLIGYMTCSREYGFHDGGDYVHMDTLYLDQERRGAGIGAQLIAHAVADATEWGLTKVRWQTPSWNSPAIRFYERVGAIGVHVDQLMI